MERNSYEKNIIILVVTERDTRNGEVGSECVSSDCGEDVE